MSEKATLLDCQQKAFIIRDLSGIMIMQEVGSIDDSDQASVFLAIHDYSKFIVRLLDTIEFLPEIQALIQAGAL
jgi:hypothetical protein